MATIAERAAQLRDALAALPGFTVYTDPGASVDPPGLVIGAPEVEWAAMVPEPTDAAFPVAVVVAADEAANAALWDHLVAVGAAIDGTDVFVVRAAVPGFYQVGKALLPAYTFNAETAL